MKTGGQVRRGPGIDLAGDAAESSHGRVVACREQRERVGHADRGLGQGELGEEDGRLNGDRNGRIKRGAVGIGDTNGCGVHPGGRDDADVAGGHAGREERRKRLPLLHSHPWNRRRAGCQQVVIGRAPAGSRELDRHDANRERSEVPERHEQRWTATCRIDRDVELPRRSAAAVGDIDREPELPGRRRRSAQRSARGEREARRQVCERRQRPCERTRSTCRRERVRIRRPDISRGERRVAVNGDRCHVQRELPSRKTGGVLRLDEEGVPAGHRRRAGQDPGRRQGHARWQGSTDVRPHVKPATACAERSRIRQSRRRGAEIGARVDADAAQACAGDEEIVEDGQRLARRIGVREQWIEVAAFGRRARHRGSRRVHGKA